MNLVLTPVDIVFSYTAIFKEPIVDQLKEEARIAFISKLMKAFGLHLNDLKFNIEALSNKWMTFSKFLNPGFFNVSYGMEEVFASLNNPLNEEQIAEFCGKLFEMFENNPVSIQRMLLNAHHSAEGDMNSFLKSLNPYTPNNFESLVSGRGVIFNLRIPEHNLSSHITVANSLFVEKGLFLYIQIEFSPNEYNFDTAFGIAKDHYQFLLNELNLIIKREN